MKFLNRLAELDRLERLMALPEGGLAVVYGRRRIGKTRLLLEWSGRHAGLYTVADQSAAEIQRRYFAEAVAGRLPGFAEVEYRDWRSLLQRLSREAQVAGWRGPIIFDELPYLVTSSPDLPSVLQRWIDHEARDARLVIAVAGSSHRMMQGLVLRPDAPLFGRAREVLDLRPIDAAYLREAFAPASIIELIELYTAWGGIPRYWELTSGAFGQRSSPGENASTGPLLGRTGSPGVGRAMPQADSSIGRDNARTATRLLGACRPMVGRYGAGMGSGQRVAGRRQLASGRSKMECQTVWPQSVAARSTRAGRKAGAASSGSLCGASSHASPLRPAGRARGRPCSDG